jgi:heme-degrading monooxygenase HmoA
LGGEEVPGMVITIFRSRLRPENEPEFNELAARMMELAESMPGFISYKLYKSEDGERCSIVEFDSHEELLAWRNLPEHRDAQQRGRERYYQEYTLHVAEPVRGSQFER